ncbi:DUF4232 domain-containing protein [Kitasatospora sp. CB02891]|uniref:DUF4232 domain-containing protein n=1 Tax=Kitasatospora sp. CB02891 TaxID=2020329 RepID=UPI000C280E92|nr:DUF4232 domain-containing protein [Kitasatospora sp. CB02891]PJN30004.1 hypothetical protein CG736_02110 [Kitasatospora sp. CB02891]
MRVRQLSAATAVVAALGVSLTACAEERPSGPVAPAAPAVPVAAELQVSPVLETAPAAPAGAGTRRCTAADLRATVSAGSAAAASDGPVVERIELANRSAATCTLEGFPGIDLISDGTTWSLPRARTSQTRTVTLPPGGTASVLIDYLPYRGRGQRGQAEFKVTSMVLTPPDDTGHLTVHWEGANPQDRRSAPQPGTQVRPITAGR